MNTTALTTPAAMALVATLVAATATDLRSRRIPNRLTLASAASACFFAAAEGGMGGLGLALGAAAAVSAPLFAVSFFRPEGFGMGDAKLVAVLALYLDWAAWQALVAALLLAGLTGAFVAVATRTAPGKASLPLAPFIAAGAVPVVLASLPLQ